ncbi:MAG TPA: glutaminyl-peptide cyclotransferase [Taishania sp.]|nr:glutaminyl-peptide cyclotransferase [Taishania sp.]
MNKLKFHFSVVVAILLLVGCSDEDKVYAKFNFKENLAASYNSELEIELETLESDIATLELVIGDSIVAKWDNPGVKKLTYKLLTNDFGIGSREIKLIAKNKAGELFKDERLFRILSDLKPEIWSYEIVDTYKHNITNFTQGLEFDGDVLYESTGQLGQSKIAKINLKTGEDLMKIGLDATHFGEGITILGDTIYQLTWTTNKCFLYDKHTLQIMTKDFTFNGEGWGICNDGKYLIMSDGSERLTFRDPKTFEIVKTIEVYTHEQPVSRLNELEYIDGLIYANIWMTNSIAVIEPETGRVIGVIDGSRLASIGRGQAGDVFNGIAYNKTDDCIYVTGKYWNSLFKLKVNNTRKEIAIKK